MEKDDRILVGFNHADDAAVVRLDNDRLLVQTVDFFTPVVDDPYLFGQISAANSLSDIYAMGATPLFALNIVGFPIQTLPHEILTQILQGGADKAREAGISIAGGHSVDDPEPKYGLVVTGEVKEQDMITNAGASPGQVLVLTKPLGTGIIATAIKRGVAPVESMNAAIESMRTLNRIAAETARHFRVTTGTDVTGFGLLGHLKELCDASRVSSEIDFSKLPFLPGVVDLIAQNIVPGGTKRNLAHVQPVTEFDSSLTPHELLMTTDAQTSGGLLLVMEPEQAEQYVVQYNSVSPVKAGIIGRIRERSDSVIFVRS